MYNASNSPIVSEQMFIPFCKHSIIQECETFYQETKRRSGSSKRITSAHNAHTTSLSLSSIIRQRGNFFGFAEGSRQNILEITNKRIIENLEIMWANVSHFYVRNFSDPFQNNFSFFPEMALCFASVQSRPKSWPWPARNYKATNKTKTTGPAFRRPAC